MSTPYYQDDSVTLYHGDALDVAKALPDRSVDCVITSPPYFGLRDYGVIGQIGIESHPIKYVGALGAVFSELRRVLADDGTLWLNLGDSYSAAGGHTDPGGTSALQGRRVQLMQNLPAKGADRPAKNLLGIPWRVAFALQDDGWILRNDVIWHKSNAMPESVTDRLSNRYEHVFLFSKSRRYRFDLDQLRIPCSTLEPGDPSYRANGKSDRRRKDHAAPPGQSPQTNMVATGTRHVAAAAAGRNPGDVWTISTQPFSGAHFATMPAALAQRCIAASCTPGGTVLDPFSGSGTTGMAAQRLGCKYVGIDLNREYLDLSLRTRLQDAALDFEAGA